MFIAPFLNTKKTIHQMGEMKMTRIIKLFLTTTILLSFYQAAHGTILTATTNIDNGYEIFISTDDSVAGTSFGSGANWPLTFVDNVTLTAGVTNYIHINAYDVGGIAMLLGEFTLSDSGFEFANGTQTMLTGDTGIQVSTVGWGTGFVATTDLGPNGTSPWGVRSGVDAGANFVWSSDPFGDNQVYFSAAINAVAVPAPAPLILLGLGLIGMILRNPKSNLAR